MAASSSKLCNEVSLHKEKLVSVDYELREIEAKLIELQERKQFLLNEKEKLKDDVLMQKSLGLARRNWSQTDCQWSKKVDEVRKSVFKLDDFRPHQLQTINAVLSKEDVILIMPTGGGKSLCYQLPAVVNKGVTLVISPLLSLMEDQLMALKALNVNAAMISSSCTVSEVNAIQQDMLDRNSKLKLLYVTPEKLAKSKRFMTKLQKMYQINRLATVAIDEVHCCSQWGHDFRPDYKFLGVLKAMFPDVPVLGLTATSTSKVTVDVQKMLNIQGCLVFKASFNRPNLYYEVRPKPSVQKECYEELTDLLKCRFAGKSGIIYTTSIKDCEELMQELRSKGLNIGCYHANLDAKLRSKVHEKWRSGKYQAVVATIAFGLGIDKPDVRFVIHHSLSKSMENFYQESGRAGRDGQPSDCILFYRVADIFRLSTMVFTQQTGLENLYAIVAYCMDKTRCRRSIIASHFDEVWDNQDCNAMCDHCRRPKETNEVDITTYCSSVFRILNNAAKYDTKLTVQKVIDSWYGKGKPTLRATSVAVPRFGKEAAEAILAHLLVEGYLKEDFHFTPYSTVSYVKQGPRAEAVLSGKHKIIMLTSGKIITELQKPTSELQILTSELQIPTSVQVAKDKNQSKEEKKNRETCTEVNSKKKEKKKRKPSIEVNSKKKERKNRKPSTEVNTSINIRSTTSSVPLNMNSTAINGFSKIDCQVVDLCNETDDEDLKPSEKSVKRKVSSSATDTEQIPKVLKVPSNDDE